MEQADVTQNASAKGRKRRAVSPPQHCWMQAQPQPWQLQALACAHLWLCSCVGWYRDVRLSRDYVLASICPETCSCSCRNICWQSKKQTPRNAAPSGRVPEHRAASCGALPGAGWLSLGTAPLCVPSARRGGAGAGVPADEPVQRAGTVPVCEIGGNSKPQLVPSRKEVPSPSAPG